jgi:hypothetical protein
MCLAGTSPLLLKHVAELQESPTVTPKSRSRPSSGASY